MQPPTRKRWLDDKPDVVEDVMKGAVDYWQNASEADRAWIRVKPWSNNPHEHYFQTVMRFMHLLRAADLKPCSRVLDVGVGTGWTSEMIARLGHTVVAVEPSPECIDIAKERAFAWDLSAQDAPLELTFHVGDITTFEAEEGSFDAVFFYDCLHHIEDEVLLFEHLQRWVKPGGVLAISEGVPPLPGSETEQEALQQMRDYSVLENPFYPEYLDYLLTTYGFPVLRRMVPIIREIGLVEIRWTAFSEYMHEYEHTNFIVATRMDLKGELSTTSESISATLEVKSATVSEGFVTASILATNTGEELWRIGGHSEEGGINLGVFAEIDGEWRELGPRFPLKDWLKPGDTTTFDVRFPARDLAEGTKLRAQLVCEQRFWGDQVGITPAEWSV